MTTKTQLRQSLTRLAEALADLNSPFASPQTRARWSGHAYYAASLSRNATWRRLPDTDSEYEAVSNGLVDARENLEDSNAAATRVHQALAKVEDIFE